MVLGEPRHVIQGNRRRIGHRLFRVRDVVRQRLAEIPVSDGDLMMVGGVVTGRQAGVGPLVVVVSVVGEGDGEGLDAPADELRHDRRHHGRIEPAAEEDPEGDLAHQMALRDAHEPPGELVDTLLLGHRDLGREPEVPVLSHLNFAVPIP